jgi:uncharacterized membrane protein
VKKHLYIGLIVFAVLLLALGRLIVRPPVAGVWTSARRPGKAPKRPALSTGLSTRSSPT